MGEILSNPSEAQSEVQSRNFNWKRLMIAFLVGAIVFTALVLAIQWLRSEPLPPAAYPSFPMYLPETKKVLFVVAGDDPGSSEVLSLEDQPLFCDPPSKLPSLSDFKYPIYFMDNEEPVLCSSSGQCIKYSSMINSWREIPGFSGIREGTAMLTLQGGQAYSSHLNSSLIWEPRVQKFRAGPHIPGNTALHCIASINGTHALMTGGMTPHGRTNKAFMYADATWTELEPMKLKRSSHSCGLVGNRKVVIAGGSLETAVGPPAQYTEVYDLETGTWSSGPYLPYHILTHATSVQLGDTFLIIGGSSSISRLNTVYEYDALNDKWIEWKQKLKEERAFRPAAYKVPLHYFNCM